ncbi:MAG: HNH endonuclease [Acidobacteriota bacterium]|nr:HNH endonuclease [Acidobacteriota bacterium]
MEQVLVLNSTYEPLQVISWQRAVRMLFQQKVEVVEEYDCEIRSVSLSIRLPSVLRLLRYIKVRRNYNQVRFNRTNIYARDRHRCQYCGHKFVPNQLTYDHVIPVARGGKKTWENIVTCCIGCNRKKGNRTPEEAGLKPLKGPKAPYGFPHRLTFFLWKSKAPDNWKSYIFWGQ